MDGKKRWQTNLGKEWISSFPGSRSAPTIVDDLIYVGTGMGNLFCISKSDGETIWRLDFEEDFKGIYPLFGHSESPYVEGELVFWTAGGTINNVLAIDRFNGALIWASEGKNERSAYHPPRVITTPTGRKILVTFSAYHMMGLDVESGELLWTHEQDNYPVPERKPGYGDTHANTIIYEDNAIYYAAGDGNCGVKLSLSEDGTKLEEIWRNKGFDSYMGGIIKINDHIYGSGTAKPQLRSINAETGQLTDSLQIGRGVVISADDMIYYYSQNGRVYLVSYDEGNMEVVSETRITRGTKEHFAHPIIHDGVLYVRRGQALMGYSLKN
jgi:outer membrane protein assembly factor BamB